MGVHGSSMSEQGWDCGCVNVACECVRQWGAFPNIQPQEGVGSSAFGGRGYWL